MDDATTHAPSSNTSSDPRAHHTPLRWVELLLILGFWTFLAVLTAANRLVDPRGPGPRLLPPSVPLTLTFVEFYLWAVLTPVIFWLSSRFTIERSNWVSRVLFFLGFGVLVAVFMDAFGAFLRMQLFDLPIGRRHGGGFGPLFGVRRMLFLNDLIVYIAVLATGFARDYFHRYRARREEAVRLQAQTAQLQAQLAEARLSALRTQLNPHFLFNTLHAVSALVERDPRGVRRMIARLSELLRYTLEGANEQEVPLQQELAFLEQYLEIMRIRFQGNLEASTRVEPEVLDALVPNLILQPLVENALKHGVGKIDGVGRIDIEARRDGEHLVLSVRDNGPAFHGSDAPLDDGVGLRNTRARLSQLYGPAQRLTLRAANGGGLAAEVTLPYHTRTDLRTAGVSAEV